MKKIISLFLTMSLLISLFSFIVYAEEQEFDVYIEAEDYSSANIPLTIKDKSKMSNGKHVNISTDNSPQDGMFYVEYRVNVPEDGAYDFRIDTNYVAGQSYSELLVCVNGGEPINLYLANNIATKDSGLSTLQVEYLRGFKKGENTIRIYLLRPRAKDYLYVASFDYFTLKKADWGISNINVVGQEFLNICELGNDISLDVEYSDPATVKKNLKLIITDYYDKEFYTEEFTVNPGETVKHIDLPEMDINHYTVKLYDGENELYFCYISVVKPLEERTVLEDSPFGIDAFLSIIGNIQQLDDNIRALKLCGASWARERFIANSFNPEKGIYNYSDDNTYSPDVIKKYNEHGLKILNMITSVPTCLKGPGEEHRLSDDLVSLYKLGYEMGKFYGNSVQAWELLNEPEITNMGTTSEFETADKLVANYAAWSIGIQDATDGVMINSSGFTPTNSEVLDLSLRNHLQDYVNVIDYHGHTGATLTYPIQRIRRDQPDVVARERKLYGLYDREIWNSEFGISGGTEERESAMQRRQAEYTVISHAESLELIKKGFAFSFSYKTQDKTWFSVKGRGPYRVYNTYSAMTDILGNPKFLGKLNTDIFTIDGYLYKNTVDNNEVLILFSDDEHTLKFDLEQAEIIDILGHSKSVDRDADGKVLVNIGPEPVYLRTSGSFDKSLFTPAKYDETVEYVPNNTETERVLIMQQYPNEFASNARFDGYQISDKTTMVKVVVTNLNDKEMRGVLNGQTYNGWNIYPKSVDVTVKPFSSTTHTFMLEKTDKVIDNLKSSVEFTAEFNGEKTNTCVTDVVSPGELKYELTDVFKGIYNPEGYTRNISGKGSKQIIGGDGKTYLTHKFNFELGTSDKWAYPRFYFDKTQSFGGSTGIVVRYDAPEDFGEHNIASRIYVYEENGATYLVKKAYYMKKGVNEIIVPWTGFKLTAGSDPDYQLSPTSIAGFSIGLNSGSKVDGLLDIPEYKILSVGVYNMITDDPGFSEIVDSYPKNNSYISESPKQITATFSDAENKVKEGTVYTYIDGHFVKSEFVDNVVTIKDFNELSEGKHNLEICYQIGGVTGNIETIEFTIDSNDYSYIDVDNSHWAKIPIEYLSYTKTLSGMGNRMFVPDGDVTRAEFVKMVVSAFGLKAEFEENAFADVSENDWFYSVVNTASACDILNGIYGGEFMGDTPITRQEMAAILYRAAVYGKVNMPKVCTKKVFIDKGDFEPYASEAISTLQRAGILEGRDKTHFVPLGTLTRAEAAKAIYEVLF